MTFSSKVKDEILKIDNVKTCCQLSESYGLLLFARGFSLKEIYISTENSSVAEKYKNIVERLSLQDADTIKSESRKYKILSLDKVANKKVLMAFGYEGNERSRRLNWGNISDECCFGAFLRGAFLACGTINDPEKSYHLEFVIPYLNLSKDLKRVMEEMNLEPKEITRNGSYILYFKDSEEIEDVLALIGATNSTLELMGIKMYKDVRNNVNRRLNFESANLDKTVNAALIQTEAIELLMKNGEFKNLPAELKEIAMLRIDNPDFSLKQIGDMLIPPLSRSGVNHRLKKLCNMAENK
ncbi:MAG: DNA-binding protein WhiA [Oscillospiraceae bacterium]